MPSAPRLAAVGHARKRGSVSGIDTVAGTPNPSGSLTGSTLEQVSTKCDHDCSNTPPGLAAIERAIRSVARVADERLSLASQQDEDGCDNGKHKRHRLVEKIALDDDLPEPRPDESLHDGLSGQQRVLMDIRPARADGGDVKRLVRNRFGPVIDEKDEPQGEQKEPNKSTEKPYHDVIVLSGHTGDAS